MIYLCQRYRGLKVPAERDFAYFSVSQGIGKKLVAFKPGGLVSNNIDKVLKPLVRYLCRSNGP